MIAQCTGSIIYAIHLMRMVFQFQVKTVLVEEVSLRDVNF